MIARAKLVCVANISLMALQGDTSEIDIRTTQKPGLTSVCLFAQSHSIANSILLGQFTMTLRIDFLLYFDWERP